MNMIFFLLLLFIHKQQREFSWCDFWLNEKRVNDNKDRISFVSILAENKEIKQEDKKLLLNLLD